MSKLLRRSIKKFTIPRTRHSSTPTTSAIFYCDASRGWIPRKLGTHSEAPRITSTIFLPALDAAVDFMQYSFAIVAIFLLDISNSRSSFNFFYFNSVSPRALFGGLCDHSQFFYLRLLQYITMDYSIFFLVYQPYVILPFMSSPLITSSFEHFP